MKQWRCIVCGYIHTGEEPPETCPVCGADRSQFVPVPEAQATAPKSEPQPQLSKQNASTGDNRQRRCTVCGYIDNGAELPEKCPVCGADRASFAPYEAPANRVADSPAPRHSENESSSDTGETGSFNPRDAQAIPWTVAWMRSFDDSADRLGRLIPTSTQLTKLLTAYHGHPIAVHIPNGVLPLAVLFAILAILLRSEPLAVAARYNMLFVLISMPVVIFTGLVDWVNQFNRRMTTIFRTKMICAIIVTILSFILTLWSFAHPQIFATGFSGAGIFILFNLLDLAAATIAGLYGGKLVFRKS